MNPTEAAKKRYFVDSVCPEIKEKAFVEGAEWLMLQPLSDRLTNEEKEDYRRKYNELLGEQKKARQERDTFYGNILSAQRGIMEFIFGEEFFKEP